MLPLVRPLRVDDLDAIAGIEAVSYPYPWTREIFRECIRAGYGCYGLQFGRELVGYAIYNWGAGESHLLNLCVHPKFQRHGYGKVLLEHSIRHAQSLGCHVMFLEVRPSNVDAGRLYRQRGFEEIGTRPAYYQSDTGREDAVVMRLELVAGTQQPA